MSQDKDTSGVESQITTLDDEPQVTPAPKAKATKAAAKTASKAAANDVEVLKGANADSELSGEMVMLTIHPTSAIGGREALFVGLNGYAYLIPRGKPYKVPVEVANVVANAVVTSYELASDGSQVEIKTPSDPHTIVPVPA